MTGNPGRRRKAGNHHGPDDCRRSATAGRFDPLREHDEQRRSAGADADPDQREGNDGKDNSAQKMRGHGRGRKRRAHATQCENAHPADDPRRAPRPDIRPVAQPRAQDLHGIVQRNEQARKDGRQREFDDHHAIERRRSQNDDRAQRCLNEAETKDSQPGQRRWWRRRDHAAAPSTRARALISIPRT